MKKAGITIFLCLMYAFLHAQVGQIKSSSDKNSDRAGSRSSSEGSSSSGELCSDMCASGCFDIAISVLINQGFVLHSHYLDRRKELPRIVSLEIQPHIGYYPAGSYLVLPGIRGNWGLFGFAYRHYALIDYSPVLGADVYKTNDFQFLLNFYPGDKVSFYFGTGGMYENYSKTLFNESILGLRGYLKNEQFVLNAEGRIATDYSSTATPRLETSLKADWLITRASFGMVYVTAGGMYQNFYSKTEIGALTAGFTLKIE